MIAALQEGSQNAVSAMQRGEKTATATVQRTRAACEAIGEIISAINAIAGKNLHVASMAEEQSTVAFEINRSVSRIVELSSQSHAEIIKTTDFCKELEKLSESLTVLVGSFKISTSKVS